MSVLSCDVDTFCDRDVRAFVEAAIEAGRVPPMAPELMDAVCAGFRVHLEEEAIAEADAFINGVPVGSKPRGFMQQSTEVVKERAAEAVDRLDQAMPARMPRIGDEIELGPLKYRVRKFTNGGDLVLRRIKGGK